MKKRILILLLVPVLLFSCRVAGQDITDTVTLRNAINRDIVPNSARGITAAQLNRILNGFVNVLPASSSVNLANYVSFLQLKDSLTRIRNSFLNGGLYVSKTASESIGGNKSFTGSTIFQDQLSVNSTNAWMNVMPTALTAGFRVFNNTGQLLGSLGENSGADEHRNYLLLQGKMNGIRFVNQNFIGLATVYPGDNTGAGSSVAIREPYPYTAHDNTNSLQVWGGVRFPSLSNGLWAADGNGVGYTLPLSTYPETQRFLDSCLALSNRIAAAGGGGSFVENDPTINTWIKAITTLQLSHWDSAYSWGNHAGRYLPLSYIPDWNNIANRPSFATVASTGNYNDLFNKAGFEDILAISNNMRSGFNMISNIDVIASLYKKSTGAELDLGAEGLGNKITLDGSTGTGRFYAPSGYSTAQTILGNNDFITKKFYFDSMNAKLSSYHPLENQRLSTSNAVSFFTVNATGGYKIGTKQAVNSDGVSMYYGDPAQPTYLQGTSAFFNSNTIFHSGNRRTDAQDDARFKAKSYVPDWSEITNKPTISGAQSFQSTLDIASSLTHDNIVNAGGHHFQIQNTDYLYLGGSSGHFEYDEGTTYMQNNTENQYDAPKHVFIGDSIKFTNFVGSGDRYAGLDATGKLKVMPTPTGGTGGTDTNTVKTIVDREINNTAFTLRNSQETSGVKMAAFSGNVGIIKDIIWYDGNNIATTVHSTDTTVDFRSSFIPPGNTYTIPFNGGGQAMAVDEFKYDLPNHTLRTPYIDALNHLDYKEVADFGSMTPPSKPTMFRVVTDVNNSNTNSLYFTAGNGDSLHRILTQSYAFGAAPASDYNWVVYNSKNIDSWTESPAHTWWEPNGNRGWGVSNTTFALGNTNEYIAEYETADNQVATIGLSSTANLEDWFFFDYYFQVNESGNLNVVSNISGESSNTIPAVAGDKYGFRLHPDGGVEAGYYREGSWITIITFSTHMTSDIIYLKGASAYSGGVIHKILNPQYK